ncbi:DUF5320 domain-containing protein [Clostridium sp.]|uniref:DUF5320 domain-containing protein n=1 Tax=Clostridium sp. TaxID=1506 RepID=UPI003D6D6F39
MARRDGTGPMGKGPLTGRGMGLGRNISNNSVSPENQKDLIAEEKINLENRLNSINNKLDNSKNDK